MEVALANPDLNPVSAGMITPDPSAEGSRLREEPSRPARQRGQGQGEATDDPRRDRRRAGGALVPRTQTALYTSQARRGIAVYRDTAGFTPYQYQSSGGGVDLYA